MMNILVESAVELSDEQRKNLESVFKKSLGKEVELQTVVDPEVLGGLRVTVNGSQRIDLSLLGKLEYVKKVLN